MNRISLSACTLCLISTSAVAGIEWKVVDSFRLIDYSGANSRFEIPNKETAYNFVTSRLSNRDGENLPPINKSRLNNPKKDYFFPTHQTVSAKLVTPPAGDCAWQYQKLITTIKCAETLTFEALTQFGEGNTTLRVKALSSNYSDETSVVVRDRLILGLGDSFASGEGNPDIPTKASQSGLIFMAENNKEIYSTGRWMKFTDLWVQKKAQWFDKQCHRSMLSQHVLAGLRLANFNDKESVTLLPLACSGAEVLDGILLPQKNPPGGGTYVSDSQINLAVKSLCRTGELTVETQTFYRGYTGSGDMKKVQGKIYKCQGELRAPDAILLSIGGNDVGFAPSIAWATIPSDGRHFFGTRAVNITNKVIDPICPKETGQKICKKNKPVGIDRIKYWLPKYYEYLSQQLSSVGLSKSQSNIYLTAYPNPIYIEDGQTLCGKERSADLVEQARSRIPLVMRPAVWEMQITQSEIGDIKKGLIDPLYQEMKSAAQNHNWNFIEGHLERIKSHGICADYARKEYYTDKHGKRHAIPLYPHIRKGTWYPAGPWEEWAYDPNRTRWFRNTNDSVLFQNDESESVMNGAFHPDYRAHAVMADQIYDSVSKAWVTQLPVATK